MKWYSWLICLVLIISGVFSGVGIYKIVTANGYVSGQIDVMSYYVIDDYKYASNTVTFYEDEENEEGVYYFRTNTNRTSTFDATENKYELLFNGQKIVNADIRAYAIYANMDINFYDLENSVAHSAPLNIYIRFYADHVALSVETDSLGSSQYLQEYFRIHGFSVEVNRIIETNAKTL